MGFERKLFYELLGDYQSMRQSYIQLHRTLETLSEDKVHLKINSSINNIWNYLPDRVVSLEIGEKITINRILVNETLTKDQLESWGPSDLELHGKNIAEVLGVKWDPIFTE